MNYECNCLFNTNIEESRLGHKGLHLNPRGGGGGSLCNEFVILDTEALALREKNVGMRQFYHHIL